MLCDFMIHADKSTFKFYEINIQLCIYANKGIATIFFKKDF